MRKTKVGRMVVLFAVLLGLFSAGTVFATGTGEGSSGATTLRWAFFTDGVTKDQNLVYAEFNKRLAKLMPDVQVEFINIPYAEYKDKYALMMAAKENLDIVWSGYLFDIDQEINKGAYQPLNDLLTKSAPKLYAAIDQAKWAQIMTDGKIYGVPFGGLATANTLNDIRVIASVADKYWPNIKTDMAKVAATRGMTQEKYDILAGFLQRAKAGGDIQKGWDVALAKWAFGDEVIDPIYGNMYGLDMTKNDMKVVNEYEIANYKLMCDNMSKWYANGYIIKDIMSIENKRAYEEKPDGNIMFSHGWVYVTTPEAQAAYSKGLGFNVYYYPLHNDWFVANARSNVNMSIPQQSKNAVKAIKLLELVNTQDTGDLATLLSYGIEGKHWTMVSPVVPGKTPMKIKTLEYDSTQGTTAASYSTYPWAIQTNLMAGVNQGFDANAADIMKALLKKSRVTPIMGFNPKLADLATEWAQVQAVVKEYGPQLEYGTLADNTAVYNEFLGKLKSAGNDKIIASLQTQLDAFLKAKK